jgi:hypothetical protein
MNVGDVSEVFSVVPHHSIISNHNETRESASDPTMVHSSMAATSISEIDVPVDIFRNNTMMSSESMMSNAGRHQDSYSGMWWTRRDVFEQHWVGTCHTLEDSSFLLFNHIGAANVYMANDWLDFCVEHLSHYFKGVPSHVPSNFESVRNKFTNYMANTRQWTRQADSESPFHSTLAILPMYFKSTDSVCNTDLPLEKLVELEVNRVQCLYTQALAATLTSLWQIGIRRVIIPTNVVDQPLIVQQAIQTFRTSGIGRDESIMEIVHVNVTENINRDIFPCNALDHLKLALTGAMSEPELSKWIGSPKQRQEYKFIYFSEPDLILHTRLVSLRLLAETIETGKVIAAHRFQPLLHAVDFPDDNVNVLNKYIPNYGNFSDFIDLDVQGGIVSCCDAGNLWPGRDNYESCGNFFHVCGYFKDPKDIEEAFLHHRRLFPYPRIRLVNGMNTFVIQEHGRLCIPQKGGTCTSPDRGSNILLPVRDSGSVPLQRRSPGTDTASVVGSSTSRVRDAIMMPFNTMTSTNHQNDNYSGMWWISRDMFEQKWIGHCRNLEGVSFSLFNNIGHENIHMSKDWLDFNVEHLSHYFKAAKMDELSNFRNIVAKYTTYLTNTSQIEVPSNERSAFQNTMAILPVYLSNGDKVCGGDILLENVRSGDRVLCLYMYALSATLTSLWHAGIRRVLIPTNFVEQPPSVIEAIQIFRNHGIGRDKSVMEIVHVNVTEVGGNKLLPSDALDLLYLALNGSMLEPEMSRWVGPPDQRDQWKFIYFSEPDLVLHTRSSSIRRLTESIEDGKLIAAHRFQPLLHAVDFPDDHFNVLNKYIPSYANFSIFSDLNVQGGDSCCDAGNWWPGYDNYPTCGSFFHTCGYNRNPANVEEAFQYHERLFAYPRVRLIDGMNVFSVQEHGRVCFPRKGGSCDE